MVKLYFKCSVVLLFVNVIQFACLIILIMLIKFEIATVVHDELVCLRNYL